MLEISVRRSPLDAAAVAHFVGQVDRDLLAYGRARLQAGPGAVGVGQGHRADMHQVFIANIGDEHAGAAGQQSHDGICG